MGKGKTTSGKQATKRRSDAATKTAPFNPGDRVQRRGSFARGTVLSCSNVAPFKTTVDIGDDSIITLPARQFQPITDPAAKPAEATKGTWTPDKPLKSHPLADRLPAMSDGEYQALKASIEQSGQIEPILTADNTILDGRHRYRACVELGIRPKLEEFQSMKFGGASALDYVIAKAMHRNMTEGQRVCAAENFADDLTAQSKPGPKSKDETQLRLNSGKSSEIAALRFGVSRVQVERARSIRKADPKLYQEIFEGRLNINQAATRLKHRTREKQVRSLRNIANVTIKDCDLRRGDNWEAMRDIADNSVRIIFADPPYNNGWKYDADPAGDRREQPRYMNDLAKVAAEAKRILTSDGSLFVVIDDANSDPLGMMLRSIGLHRQPTIVWVESFGVYNSAETSLALGARYVHWFTRTASPLINTVEARVKSWRQDNGDARAQAHGRMPDNVWNIPRVTSQSAERVPWLGQPGQPPQLPLELPRRCILLASNPGDTVLDPYNGNGVTGVAALTEQRKYIGIDRSAKYIEQSRKWIASEFARLSASSAPLR